MLKLKELLYIYHILVICINIINIIDIYQEIVIIVCL